MLRLPLAAFALFALLTGEAGSQQPVPAWRHGMSLTGDLRLPADFPHFDYVDPNAPKGGRVRIGSESGFDSFNPAIPRGVTPLGLQRTYQTLMARSDGEPAAQYGEVAEAARYPDDFSSVTFRLDPRARWHDGRPITPEDVLFSFEVFKQNDPTLSFYYRNVVRAEKSGEREVTFTFDRPGNRELPQIVGELPVLPQHWWTGTDANGNRRDITQTTLEPPLGSGPYRIASFEPNRTITYRRVEDWWAAALPVNVGRYNFDEITYVTFRDETVAFEAFKADVIDWRTENSARQWSTQYDFPAIRDNRVVRENFRDRGSGRMQAFAFNTRRARFQDPRVRLAFNYAFDFEEANRNLFYGLYRRIDSYFYGTELASSGLPEGLELDILNAVRGQVPPEVFTQPFRNPVGGSAQATRDNLREAQRLLQSAGWTIRDRALVNAQTGERMRVEFLIRSPADERLVLPYKTQLERLGVEVLVRMVDDAQYQNRLRTWDYDVVTTLWAESLSPGNEQREFWGSEAAGREGSRNVAGIRNPAVDALVDRVIFATHRDELVAATRALDRVLLWNHYVVPQFTSAETWTARWDRFGRPATQPAFGSHGFPDNWWWDAGRAARLAGARP